ncbi:hypothetical protein HJC23_002718 [Cyclotella cryptica]|uniref:Thioredoxin domain-containing protein n=1 Tax=Cyclotella cryptica TaxID=29204 RepID=A0ABD3PB33_9STRA|eukprot:CCRYP_016039-RA/>CCRYP_016039-RA protein AED:0.02 eAED:0.02 QI:270/1/1/1/1/1/4/33/756
MSPLSSLLPIVLMLSAQAHRPIGWLPRTARHDALLGFPRGGSTEERPISELSLDERVNAAMRRLGLDATEGDDGSSVESSAPSGQEMNCEDGLCTLPADVESDASSTAPSTEKEPLDIESIASSIAAEFDVPNDIVMAAIYSSFSGEGDDRTVDQDLARKIVQAEVDAISGVSEDCDEVKQLVSEGFNPFFSRRSLAFSDMNVDDARAILLADQEDEDAERQQLEEQAPQEAPMKTVTVEYPKDFDPLATAAAVASPPQQQQQQQQQKPTPAKKADVVFEGTTSDLQTLVIESTVPVLLDVYADWCGPCKQLTPALEQIIINAGGMLRLVKINTDQQRQISSALEITSLPTVFGIRDGKILNMFQGIPRDESAVRNFLMGLMVPGQSFNPPVTPTEKSKYEELSAKLLKLSAAASFSFSARERLQNKILKDLDELVNVISGEDEESTVGMAVADDTARVLRSLMSNVIQNPFEEKFRKIKLDNKVIASKVAKYAPCISILKSIGFSQDGESTMIVGKGKKVVNVAPFVTGRDMIDKWIDKNRYQIAAANRKRKDEIERVKLAAEAEERAKDVVETPTELDEEEDEVDSNRCIIKLRMEGKKKVHDVEMDADDTLSALLEKLPCPVEDEETVQFTCAAKRLIVKSTDSEMMQKTLSDLRLTPTASIVVKIGEGKAEVSRGSLAERASSTQKKKTGSHSMHSIGLYAKDDGNKAELFDGGGGVLYEHDVTDDEAEDENGEKQNEEDNSKDDDSENKSD